MQNQQPQEIDEDEMRRIEGVEQVLVLFPPLSVIEKQKRKSDEHIRPLPVDRDGAAEALKDLVEPEEIENQDQDEPLVLVVREQKCGKIHESDRLRDLKYRGEKQRLYAVLNQLPQIQHEETQKKREVDVLMGRVDNPAVESQVERDLRDKGEDKHAEHVLFAAPGIEKALDQEKAEDRKCDAADAPEHLVQLIKGIQIRAFRDRETGL